MRPKQALHKSEAQAAMDEKRALATEQKFRGWAAPPTGTSGSLSTLSDQELQAERNALQAEVNRRAEIAAQEAAQEQKEHADLIRKNLAVLLEFTEHSRTSCSDEHKSNAERGCPRCMLFECEWRDDVRVSVQVKRVEG